MDWFIVYFIYTFVCVSIYIYIYTMLFMPYIRLRSGSMGLIRSYVASCSHGFGLEAPKRLEEVSVSCQP